MEKFGIGKNVVISCVTFEEAKKVLKIGKELGFKWCSGKEFLEDKEAELMRWNDYKADIAYNLFNGTYSSVEKYGQFNHVIVPGWDFIEHYADLLEKEKCLDIEIPEGYEIDKEKSTFTKIVFTKIKRDISSWTECFVGNSLSGYYITDHSEIESISLFAASDTDVNVFKTKSAAESALAYAKLTQLMALPEFNGEWTPDWDSSDTKYCIAARSSEVPTLETCKWREKICLKTWETCQRFLDTYEDLLKVYFELND